MAAAGIASGEKAFDDAFEAGRTRGQRLHILAQGSKTGTDFSDVGPGFFTEVLDFAPDFLPKTLDRGPLVPDFGAKFGQTLVWYERARRARWRPSAQPGWRL